MAGGLWRVRGRALRVGAAAVAVVLTAGLWQSPGWADPTPDPDPGSGLEAAPGESTPVTGVPVKAAKKAPSDTLPRWQPSGTTLPAGGSGVVAVAGGAAAQAAGAARAAADGPVAVGGLPVAVRPLGAPAGGASTVDGAAAAARAGQVGVGSVLVEVASPAAAKAVGVHGVLFTLTRADGDGRAGSVGLDIDYAGFRDAYGGDYGARLRLVELPACALSTPAVAACRVQTPVGGARNTVTTSTVSADAVAVAGELPSAAAYSTSAASSVSVLALAPGTSSATGDYRATSWTAAGSWTAGTQGGDFSYQVPLRVPPGLGGPVPELALSYSSGSVDGRNLSTNTQASWVGEGWDFWPGFIERSYRPCSDDGWSTGDLCSFSESNATMNLRGRSTRLVKDDASGAWRGESDDGERIEQLFEPGFGSGDQFGEYWRVTEPDGTEYFFGRNRRYAGDGEATNSVQLVPVFGNTGGEPCAVAGDPDSSACWRGYRWNLDYVIDPRGNTMTYFYGKYAGRYGAVNGKVTKPYDLSAFVDHIDYGTREETEGDVPAPARVQFGIENRCTEYPTCRDWPDVPLDQYCYENQATCANLTSPVFWQPYRLARVITKVWDAATGDYRQVDAWEFTHAYPATGDFIAPKDGNSDVTG